MTPEPDYVVWGTTALGGFATVLTPENVPDAYELSEGVSRADGFPPDAAFRMNPSFPRDVALADAVQSRGGNGVPLVSPALRGVIEGFAPPDIEALPVTIYDHKGRVASDAYVVLNSFHVVDCLDHDRMGVVWNPLDPASIASCDGVVLDPARIDGAPALFRAKNLENRVLVRRDVAEAVRAAGLTGTFFWEPADVTA
jgi:hypothetical protein